MNSIPVVVSIAYPEKMQQIVGFLDEYQVEASLAGAVRFRISGFMDPSTDWEIGLPSKGGGKTVPLRFSHDMQTYIGKPNPYRGLSIGFTPTKDRSKRSRRRARAKEARRVR